MEPAKIDFAIFKGNTFRKYLQLRNSDGTFFNLTSYTVRAYLRKNFMSPAFINMNAAVADAANGKISLSMTPTQTKLINFAAGVYDLKIIYPTLEEFLILQGNVSVKPEVSYAS